jgi:protein required for attachment to host cells
MIWVIAANAVTCRIFHYGKNGGELTLIKQISHPENRLKMQDYLTSDRPGHFKSGADSRGSFQPRTAPKDVELNNFAREIGREIMRGRKAEAFNKLIVIATPQMGGLIFSHVDKLTEAMVMNYIHKDPQHFTESDILTYLKKFASYPDSSKH